MGKHIKVDMRSAAQKAAVPAPQALPPIPDLILQFATDKTIYTLRVPSAEMGNMAQMMKKVCEKYGIKYTLEEKPR